MPWFETGSGYRLWYEDRGSGGAIVFIHGWCMSSAVWELQCEGLSDSFRVITIDLPGHGNSPAHIDGFHIKGCAKDIASLMAHLRVKDAIVAGWSLGALIAVETFLLTQERCAGLALISGTPRFVQAHDFPFGLTWTEAEGMAKKVQRSIRRALEGFSSRMFLSGEVVSATVHRLLSSIPAPTTDVALQALKALVGADMRDSLALITCPVLILHGDGDVICLPQASEFMSRQIPNSCQVVFSGCGHVPFLTQSDKFNACLEEFRGRVCGDMYRQE
jgi:pimeloyl-[acyl-carrier protein] methyl ester esterase